MNDFWIINSLVFATYFIYILYINFLTLCKKKVKRLENNVNI